MKTKRSFLFILFSTFAAVMLLPCVDHETHAEINNYPKISAPDQYEDETIWYCNRLSSRGTLPFSLPEAREYPSSIDKHSYTDVSPAYYNSFLTGLTTEGFSLVSMKYGDFLFRDDCMVFSEYREDDGFFSVSWYQESTTAAKKGISYEEAASFLLPDRDKSLSTIPLHPIDITPDGFYERTGGQIFAVPYYSYDIYKSSGRDHLMSEDNEWYDCNTYCVIGDSSFMMTNECVAACDIDNDGSNEVILLSFGPTSGNLVFVIICITKLDVYNNIIYTDYNDLGFSSIDGRIVIEAVRYDTYHHYYDIMIEENDTEKALMLYEDGERLPSRSAPDP